MLCAFTMDEISPGNRFSISAQRDVWWISVWPCRLLLESSNSSANNRSLLCRRRWLHVWVKDGFDRHIFDRGVEERPHRGSILFLLDTLFNSSLFTNSNESKNNAS